MDLKYWGDLRSGFSFHLSEHGAGQTKVMIFCQYRDSVTEITLLLRRHRPLIKPMQFVGQAPSVISTNGPGKTTPRRKFTQKDQLMVCYELLHCVKQYFR